ncbi:MAG: ABC transporter permease [Oscillospiraceae bacterium]
MNLLKADFFRFFRDKTTYILLGIVFLLPPLSCLMYRMSGDGTFTTEVIVFKGLGTDILCAVLGLLFSLFLGKEYSNNTIRNKLCYGENRFKIAACFFLESVIITLIFVAVSIISSLIFGSVLGTFEFSDDFLPKLFCQTAIIIAFSVLITAVVVSSKNMKAGFMVTLMISVVFTAISYALPSLAVKYPAAETACRSLYMVVSTMLISSVDGVYHVGTQFAFENIYSNALLLSSAYILLSVGASMLAVKKQSYK